ncbi:MAG: ABC transporter permease [Acidobacteriaceae bacterium]
MDWLRILMSRCKGFAGGRKLDEELDEELRSHLDFAVEENVKRGMSEQEARTAALRKFGGVTQTRERYRMQRGLPFLEGLMQDIRFALRQLWKSPGFAFTAIFTLALGIAATVAIFGFVDSALIQPLPYRSPSRLVSVFETRPQSGPRSMFSHANYLDLERSNRVFASIAAYDVRRKFVLSDAGGAHPVSGTGVTGGFFRTLGITPVLGRDFVADSANEGLPSAEPAVILSYAAWQKRFGGNADVLGTAVTLNGESYTIIGVLPRSFQFAPTGGTEFWTTLHAYAADACELQRGCLVTNVVARVKNGVTLKQALANAQAIAAEDAKQYPDADRGDGANIVPLSRVILGDIQPILLALLGGTALLLLIAYINVASLLLVRSENRRREFAVRGALGAARGRLIQQFVTEGLVMAAASTVLGLAAASLTGRLLLKLVPTEMLNSMPYLRSAGWNWHIAAFAAALVTIACILFAAMPMLRLPFADLRAALTEGDRGSAGMGWRRLGARLVILELATTMVLLAGAGLLGKSFYKLLHVDIGFVPSHLATVQIMPPDGRYAKGEQAIALQRAVVNRVESLPGVTAAGTANALPISWEGAVGIGIAGRPNLGEHSEVGYRQVGTGYFSVLEAQLLRGRYFNENDSAAAPSVVIINQSLARRFFPGENPIGRQIFYHGQPQHPMRIVGVIADVKEGALDEKDMPFMYRPFEQDPSPLFDIAARTSQAAASVLPSLIDAVHEIDPGIATFDAATMPEMIEDSSAAYLHRASAWLAGGFAALALILSVVGLYGVISYSVSQRTREIGVRMALGAQRSSVYRLILKEAGWLTLIGVVIGVSGSLAAGMFMRSLLFDVRSWDASILGAVAAVLIISALLASYIPARRAASIDPIRALRSE